MDNVGPLTAKKSESASISAHEVLKEVMSTDGSVRDESSEAGVDVDENTAGQTDKVSESAPKLSSKAIKSVLELLCDESVSFRI